jgi:small subunit ribosomal protein S18
MAQKKPARTRAPKDSNKKFKKKTSVLVQEKVGYVDYKDVDLLQRFVSDRSKIRSRRVSGNDVQQQRDVATAIKNAREMGLMAYTKRVSTTRAGRGPRDDDRGRRAEAVDTTVDTGVDTAVEELDIETGVDIATETVTTEEG